MTSDNIVETSELIGAGTYRKILKVSYYGANCVAKELFGTPEASDAKAGTAENDIKDHFVNKAGQLLAQLCHPNIVQFFGIHFKPDPTSRKMRPIMIMEKMESSLSAFLENHSNIPTAVKFSILLDVSLGLRYLHGQKPAVVHCNLTSNNVLLTSQLQAKIGDVGVIQMMGYEKQSQKKNVQCEAFMAPEVRTNLLKMSYAELVCHPSVDIFSYGAVILHTITQQWPEQPLDDGENVTSQTESQRHHAQLNQIAMSSKRLLSLITACLDNDPNKRPTTIQVSEIMKKMSEKLPVVTKSPVVWQAEVEEAHKQVRVVVIAVATYIHTVYALGFLNNQTYIKSGSYILYLVHQTIHHKFDFQILMIKFTMQLCMFLLKSETLSRSLLISQFLALSFIVIVCSM